MKLSIRLPPDLADWLLVAARESELSVSELVREILRREVERAEKVEGLTDLEGARAWAVSLLIRDDELLRALLYCLKVLKPRTFEGLLREVAGVNAEAKDVERGRRPLYSRGALNVNELGELDM